MYGVRTTLEDAVPDEAFTDSNAEYDQAIVGLAALGAKVKTIAEDVCDELDVRFQYVDFRVKEKESAFRKLELKEGKYSSIAEFTDLLGLRVVTYLADDVGTIVEGLKVELDIDDDNSENKLERLGADRFGYLSTHLVATLKSKWTSLPGYRAFGGVKFEVQIRSVLQDAWAEIEHDLGYKATQATPLPTKRRFNRLSALLEIADDEFVELKRELTDYKTKVQSTVRDRKTELGLDQESLLFAVGQKSEYIELDQRVSRAINRELDTSPNPQYIAGRAADLQTSGITTIDKLTEMAEASANYIETFAHKWAERPQAPRRPPTQFLPLGVFTFYLDLVYRASNDLPPPASWSDARVRNTWPKIKKAWTETTTELGPYKLELPTNS